MSEKNNHNFIYSMIVMIFVLVLSYSLDFIYYSLLNQAQETITIIPVWLPISVIPFGIAALVALITWFSITRTNPRSPVQVTYLIVGLLFQSLLVSSHYFFPRWLRGSIVDTFRQVVFSHVPPFFSIVTALLLILGIIGLVRKPQSKAYGNNLS